MLELLSDMLREVLRTGETHETALSREVEFLERYLAIEQIRFSDRLRLRIEINPQIARAAVPRFLLQPLVENALRHGIAHRAEAGRLEVSAYREGEQLAIVQLDRVRELRTTERGDEAILRDGSRIPVSRRRRAVLDHLLRKH